MAMLCYTKQKLISVKNMQALYDYSVLLQN